MSAARYGGEAKVAFGRLSERLRTVAETLRRLPANPDLHGEDMQSLRREIDAIRAELLAIDRKPWR
jgi:hypothetical protein